MEGYTLLEYIESDGTQYINTGFIPDQDTKIVADMLVVANNTSLSVNGFFGARTSSSSKAFGLQFHSSRYVLQLFYGNGYTEQSENLPTERTIYTMDKGTVSYNGKSITRDYMAFQCDFPMYIFALNNAGSAAFQSKIRLFSFQIYDNGVLVRDYIPCQSSTGEIGLYDKVNDLFYPSANGVNFTGKWLYPKELKISLQQFRRRLMSALPSKPNYSNGVYIEDTTGKLWMTDEWDGSATPNGIAVLTDNCRFVMALENARNNVPWGSTTWSITSLVSINNQSDAKKYYLGKEDTELIVGYVSANFSGPVSRDYAARYAHEYTFPNGQNGYLGSAGEWQAAIDYFYEIIAALSACGIRMTNWVYWTSTQCDKNRAWVANFADWDLVNLPKSDTYNIRAFTTLKSET